MAISGPPADRGGVQKPYAIGYACGWVKTVSSGEEPPIIPWINFDIKVCRIFIKLTACG